VTRVKGGPGGSASNRTQLCAHGLLQRSVSLLDVGKDNQSCDVQLQVKATGWRRAKRSGRGAWWTDLRRPTRQLVKTRFRNQPLGVAAHAEQCLQNRSGPTTFRLQYTTGTAQDRLSSCNRPQLRQDSIPPYIALITPMVMCHVHFTSRAMSVPMKCFESFFTHSFPGELVPSSSVQLKRVAFS
jgi:hypothetical protein